MNKSISFSFYLFIICPFITIGQTNNDFCGVGEFPYPNPDSIYNQSTDANYLSSISAPVVYNIYFWGINDDNGNNPNPFTETKALSIIARLNIAFNNNNIFFKYRGFDFINETDIFIATGISQIKSYAIANNKVKTDAFNMYIPYQFTNPNLTGDAFYRSTFSAVKASMVDTYIPAHEIGHNFNLLHTFHNYNNSSCERVTRLETDPLYNADEAGDWITDTDACPTFATGINHNNCSYTGTETNFYSENFIISEETIRTFMSYISVNSPCPDSFTVGQKVRVRQAITANPSVFLPVKTNIEALYEPYIGSYPSYFPHPLPWQLPLFQPGFEYHFVECCCEYVQPALYGDTAFSYDTSNIISLIEPTETNYSSIYHPNHSAIKIIEVDNAVSNPQVERCYDNWQSPPIIGGDIVKFNDNVFNANVTITPQDSTSINNPNLIAELAPGLYNIIKTDSNGNNQETVVYKENN